MPKCRRELSASLYITWFDREKKKSLHRKMLWLPKFKFSYNWYSLHILQLTPTCSCCPSILLNWIRSVSPNAMSCNIVALAHNSPWVSFHYPLSVSWSVILAECVVVLYRVVLTSVHATPRLLLISVQQLSMAVASFVSGCASVPCPLTPASRTHGRPNPTCSSVVPLMVPALVPSTTKFPTNPCPFQYEQTHAHA